MKVVCRRLVSPTTGEELEASPWLTIGQEYSVLSVVASPDRGVSFRLEGDAPGPGLWDSRLFEIVTGHVPAGWTAGLSEGGVLTLAPSRWQRPGFWEDYFDGVPEAVAAFEDEAEAILAQEADGT
jgi:hypothetical protein